MFYLNNFFRVLINKPFRGLTFIILTLVLSIAFAQRTFMEKKLLTFVGKYESYSHFHSLVKNTENFEQISYRLASLPGVMRVEKIGESKLIKNANDIIMASSYTDVDLINEYPYFGIKVILNDALSNQTIEMIRTYLKRMVGESNLTMGPLIKVDPKKKVFFTKVKKWGALTFIVFLMTIWCMLLHQMRKELRRRCYIIEQFQRRKNVEIKSSTLGMMLLLSFGIGLALIFGQLQWKDFSIFAAFVFAFGILSTRKYSWEEISSL